ncbi:MAG: 50S ribosomal protein L9 [Armatimonadota bacterium]|nr:50S ribosomal protein L9 [Armatimonadota bacterium]MDR7401026.1 50S ribosomal protein L9 [Armatimonadota bacterium]MDR7403234.1 50S ribosomal protein L9 [Armatimonadota bacterium]MDR7436737.1 50S ribosomal protein L9 [Armatimonadota bacterium]MDR7471191.1 50S ribosomal protein L9 [Armatimonadota bacterium]
MKVVLLADVRGLGRAGDVVEVKDGYARNYLLPRGLAAEATAGRVRAMQDRQQARARRQEREQEQAARLAEALKGTVVEVRARAGEGGRLFGSVTAADIAEALAARGFDVSKRQVELEEPIKAAGVYTVPVRIAPGVVARVEVNVLAAP